MNFHNSRGKSTESNWSSFCPSGRVLPFGGVTPFFLGGRYKNCALKQPKQAMATS